MSASLLREFVLLELRRDEKFIASLKAMRGGNEVPQIVSHIVDEWIEDAEFESGRELAYAHSSQVMRFATERWPALIRRFRGDQKMAAMTLNNNIDAKYSDLKAPKEKISWL